MILNGSQIVIAVSYTHLRAHETRHDLVCRLLLEKKKKNYEKKIIKTKQPAVVFLFYKHSGENTTL